MKKLYNLLDKNEFNIVLMDFFDTIVHRDIHPDTIKQLWSMRVANLFCTLDEKLLYLTRIASERYLSSKHIEYSYGLLCDEIIKRLINDGLIKEDISCLKDRMIEIEMLIEREHLFRDEDTYAFLRECHAQNRRIFVISDFYLSSNFLRQILVEMELGDWIEDIFVSCELGVSKARGQLYEVVLKQVGFEKNCAIMIGDNYKVDCRNARRNGIRAFHKKYKNSSVKYTKENIGQMLLDLEKKYTSSFYDYFAYSLYFFIESLYREVKKDGVSNVFFLAREGNYLKSLFEGYLSKIGDTDICTHYLFVSRKSTYLPSLKEIENESFEVLLNQNRNGKMSCDTFLNNIGFTLEERKYVKNELGFGEEFYCKYYDFFDIEQFNYLTNNQVFRSLYEKKRKESKNNLLNYLHGFGVNFQDEGMFIVDVGWKGTIQDNLYKVFSGNVNFIGYYLGLEELTTGEQNNIKKGILYSKVPYESSNCRQWSSNRLEYEDILQAPHPSTSSYQKCSDGIKPVFDEKENSVLYEKSMYIQERISILFAEISDVFQDTVFSAMDVETYFLEIMQHSILKCSVKDIRIHNEMNGAHYNNFISLQSVDETRKHYTKHVFMNKIIRWVKNMNEVMSGKYFIKFCGHIYKAKMIVLLPIYKIVVYYVESSKWRKQYDR